MNCSVGAAVLFFRVSRYCYSVDLDNDLHDEKHVSLNIMVFYKLRTVTAVILKLPTTFVYVFRSVHSITKEQHSNSKTQNVLP